MVANSANYSTISSAPVPGRVIAATCGVTVMAGCFQKTCFGGSGSTLIAAEQAERRALLMELDPLYCDVIVERWQRFTGRRATRQVA